MVRVMFVCHGNICRSPMAKFMFLKMVEEEGLKNYFQIDSSATSTEEIYMGIGNPMHPGAKQVLDRFNVPYSNHYAKLLTRSDYDRFDYFICMDKENIRNTLFIFNEDEDEKVKLLLDFANENRSVSDPWYTRRFDVAYQDIETGLKAFLQYLKEKGL